MNNSKRAGIGCILVLFGMVAIPILMVLIVIVLMALGIEPG